MPLVADCVTVDLTEAVRPGEEPLARLGPSQGRVPKFRRAGRASVHAGASESLEELGAAVIGTLPSTPPPDDVTLLPAGARPVSGAPLSKPEHARHA